MSCIVYEPDSPVMHVDKGELLRLRAIESAACAVVRGRIPAVSAELEGSDWKHSRISDSLIDKLAAALGDVKAATPMPSPEPECGHDEEMAEAGARVEMLDSVCKWLAGHGYKPAADEVFAERGRWFYPQHPQHWTRDEEHLARERATPSSGSAFKVGDVVAFVDRCPKFRVDALATRYGEPAAEMTMIVNERGEACAHRQLGGPAPLKNAVVLPSGQFTSAAPEKKP